MRRLLLALGALLIVASTAAAADQGRYPYTFNAGVLRSTMPAYVTEPPYNAVCNGTADDASAFAAAYTALASTGGEIVVPAGRTCRFGSDVLVKSNVNLRCEPGAILKSTATSSFAFGMFTSFSVSPAQFSTTNNAIEGCTFDLNTRLGPAIFLTGTGFSVRRNAVSNGDTAEASDHNLVRVNCGGGDLCEVRQNKITCASTSGAKDIGLTGAGVEASGNAITGCDSAAISITAESQVTTNVVSATGTAGSAITSSAVAMVRGNTVTVSNGSRGIYFTSGAGTGSIVDNKINDASATNEAIRNEGNTVSIAGNRWFITSNTAGAGNDTTVGLYSSGQNCSITGNIGNVTTIDAQTHMFLGGAQTVATGNNLTKGAYCARPIDGAINVNFVGNRCYTPGVVGVVGVTGWMVGGNYIAWVAASTGRAAILVGDDTQGTSLRKYSVDHMNIFNNIISSVEAGVSGIETAVINKVCDGGSKINETCTTDDQNGTTGCPGTVGSGHCDAQTFEGVQVTGNHFIFGVSADQPAVDFSTGVTSTSGDTWNWVVTGNTFDLKTSDGVAMFFPSSNQTKVRNIQIGVNSFVGNLRLQNWLPTMGFDAMTTRYPLPVGGCDLSGTATLLPASGWGLPSTTAAAKACRPASGNYRYGVFQFAQAADKEALVTLPLTGDANQSYNPVFVRLRFSYVTSSPNTVQWVVRAHCITPSEDPDLSFGAENGSEAVFENIAGISDADATMLTSYLKLPLPSGCFGGDLLEILVSRDGNDTTGTDNYASDVNLFDAEVTVSINKMSN